MQRCVRKCLCVIPPPRPKARSDLCAQKLSQVRSFAEHVHHEPLAGSWQARQLVVLPAAAGTKCSCVAVFPRGTALIHADAGSAGSDRHYSIVDDALYVMVLGNESAAARVCVRCVCMRAPYSYCLPPDFYPCNPDLGGAGRAAITYPHRLAIPTGVAAIAS